MAKKQTRRTISVPRQIHAALRIEAAARGKCVSQFVIDTLRAAGIDLPPTEHLAIERVDHALECRRERKRRREQGYVASVGEVRGW